MTSRERVLTALRHEEPDRVPVDMGGMVSTGIMAMAYNKLKAHLGMTGGRTRMYDLYQQLAEPEPEMLEHVGADVVSLFLSGPEQTWRPSTLPDGSPCEVPASFQPEPQADGSQVLRDEQGNIVGRMPENGYYFDWMHHPLADVDTIAGLEKVPFHHPIPQEMLDNLRERAKALYDNTDYAIMLNGGGSVFEAAQNLRGWDVFMMDLAGDPAFAGALMDKLAEATVKHLEQILPAVEGYVQVIQTGDDLGTQEGPQVSPRAYRELVKPRQKRVFEYIKAHSSAHIFIHTCGAVSQFIPDLIEMGVDALNPVQVGAKGMNSDRLKREFGKDITFWGGGCDTQQVLPFGTPDDVRAEVKRRVADLAPGGGFVFAQVHNIQVGVPPENIVAMYDAIKEFGSYGG